MWPPFQANRLLSCFQTIPITAAIATSELTNPPASWVAIKYACTCFTRVDPSTRGLPYLARCRDFTNSSSPLLFFFASSLRYSLFHPLEVSSLMQNMLKQRWFHFQLRSLLSALSALQVSLSTGNASLMFSSHRYHSQISFLNRRRYLST